MKYVTAIVVCAAEIVAYVYIAVFLGWKNSGGVIPMTVLFAVMGATWTVLTDRGEKQSKPDDANEQTK
jgi:hypothetical protein